MNPFLALFIGMLIAAPVVLLILACCAAAADADERMAEMRHQHEQQKTRVRGTMDWWKP